VKLTSKDIFGVLIGIVFTILYLLSGEFILLLVVLIVIIPGFYFERKENITWNQKIYGGLISGAIALLIYGIYVSDFWVMLLITAGAVAFVWLILKLIKAL
jgi:hypothetical protein